MARTLQRRYCYKALQTAIDLPCDRETAKILGVSMRTVIRYRSRGVPESMADHVAIAFNSHPGFIWPEQWWGSVDDD